MQFDVYCTPGRGREIFPYLVDVQSNLADEFSTRFVVPLMLAGSAVMAMQRANPLIEFEGQSYLFVANQLANISASRLGKPLGNIDRWREEMVAAIDFMITGI